MPPTEKCPAEADDGRADTPASFAVLSNALFDQLSAQEHLCCSRSPLCNGSGSPCGPNRAHQQKYPTCQFTGPTNGLVCRIPRGRGQTLRFAYKAKAACSQGHHYTPMCLQYARGLERSSWLGVSYYRPEAEDRTYPKWNWIRAFGQVFCWGISAAWRPEKALHTQSLYMYTCMYYIHIYLLGSAQTQKQSPTEVFVIILGPYYSLIRGLLLYLG